MKNLPSLEEFLNESVSTKASNFFKKYLEDAYIEPKLGNGKIQLKVALHDPASGDFRSHQFGGRKPASWKEIDGLAKSYNLGFYYDAYKKAGFATKHALMFNTTDVSDILNFIDDLIVPINPKLGEDLKQQALDFK